MSSLGRLIEQEISLLQRFVEQLELEQKALAAAQAEPLEAIARGKIELIESINGLEQERQRFTGGVAQTGDRSGMQSWIAANPNHPQVAALWQQVMSLTQKAQMLHEQNGQLLTLLSNQASEALNVLRRLQQGPSLYGSDGQTASASSSRIVDAA